MEAFNIFVYSPMYRTTNKLTMLFTEKHLNLFNNRIYVRIATSQNVKPKLAIVLILGDHSGRYMDWMEKFEDLGVV